MNELLELANRKKAGRKPLEPKKLSASEIQDASDHVKTNLINIMVSITQKLASDNSIGPANLVQLSRLTDTASKLFAWPHPKPFDQNSLPALQNNTVINLPLIRTTPEQLRAKARLITQNSPNQASEPSEQKKLAG